MDDALEALAAGYLDGSLDPDGRARLEEALDRDPEALREFADQLQVHHRLAVALGEPRPLEEAVVRELRLQADAPRFSAKVVRTLKSGSRPRIWEAVAAALVLGVLVFFLASRQTPTPAAPRGVLFVVGVLPLEPGDARVRDRLERIFGGVTVRLAAEATRADATGRALVAISSTSLARVAAAFRDVPVPLVTWEPRLYPDLGFVEGQVHQVDWAAARDQTHLVVESPGHPLAAGLSGRVQATAGPAQFSWGRVRPEAIRIAALEGNPARTVIFGFEPGGAMPARRAGLFLFDTTATSLTDQGWSLFDAAVLWLIGRSP